MPKSTEFDLSKGSESTVITLNLFVGVSRPFIGSNFYVRCLYISKWDFAYSKVLRVHHMANFFIFFIT